jgi:argininosuccinate synthase
VEVARQTGADAVGHGATGKGNDQVRFELTYMALAPDLKIIAPWKDPDLRAARPRERDRLRQQKRRARRAEQEEIYSRDRNLWHISHEGADLESPPTSRRTICG